MHDRRIDGEPAIFGNAGALYMRAMTWYDHKTESIWSQPWGRALSGPLAGTELALLPSQITTWGQWRASYPQTLALTNDASRLTLRRQGFSPDFVIGLVLAEAAKAYPFEAVRQAGIINDMLGGYPIAVWVNGEEFRAYIRQTGGQVLTLEQHGDRIIDRETGSVWDIRRGLAVAGPLTGATLVGVPSLSAYDWAWSDFFPDSEIYEPD